MIDVVKRLQKYRPSGEWGPVHHVICTEAADVIGRLRKDISRYKLALKLVEAVDDWTEINGQQVCLTPIGKIIEASTLQVQEIERLREVIDALNKPETTPA